MSMSLYKHKALRNKRCGSSKCNNAAKKRVLLSFGFSASFCKKCADELIQDNLGVEEVVSAGQDVNIANEVLIKRNE
jgi:hypothetical protein